MNSLATAMETPSPGANPTSPGLAGRHRRTRAASSRSTRPKFLAAYDAEPAGRQPSLFAQGGSSTNANDQVHLRRRPHPGRHLRRERDAGRDPGDGDRPHRRVADRRRRRDRREASASNQIIVRGEGRPTRQADVVNGLNTAFANAGLSLAGDRERHRDPDRRRTGTATTRTFDVDCGTAPASAPRRHRRRGNDQRRDRDRQRPAADGAVLRHPASAGSRSRSRATRTGDLGHFTYTPGLAQRVETACRRRPIP